ncbi:GTPase [Moraxella nasicaprae]|uniref:50S ribosome-binding GTPase n=1 Tax=Moraxella nasicaprae TaxID=2904122 RepID=A0ABY6F3K2_9GAMM|nr:GTPase [Moraxella nasicaprae]UXZ04663.1 50S ribosome-binding GTPase [Moraxella nasicaprae]
MNAKQRVERLIKQAQLILKEKKHQLDTNNESETPVVATWGLMNAGKSYLLNMLTHNIDKEYFKTNDIRETAEVHRLVADGCVFLDTPGLDANAEDNAEALKGVAQADVVLFVHQLQGELEQVEVDFLKEVANSFGKYASENIIIVISKIDKESPEKVKEIQEKILKQCRDELGFSPQCFQISNTRYHKGEKEHKDVLIEQSHILLLRDHIQKLIKENANHVRKQRKNHKLQQYQTELVAIERELKQLQTEIFTPYYQALKKVDDHILDVIRPEVKAREKQYNEL